ncbi:cobalamin biosynthesis protein CobD [Megasphaera cerevisiae DSM 20462]|jgi:adenosylcobinamide-phosphate synthase|uniref:Cobalamin biosynthesis protein CobD n=1 Tax=Megasphaera cerevisiae DSM 20462 TaxID=1122219 RepID=A0A0J6WZN2_9FIRM|nr:adenosylcobinamide-phosphate synthase CbiB [Megasphaera cerevisiae]KMO87347.1 cobalamin biosynthesis protein CobD [Megasphaera cerevisiae DSM 20462]MCI1749966.1 adenosylcobinamide-phosphate synthase CbiB [Megasphaera cerevisiae]OKY54856.1 cobalamin biosynthesis protein CobD [Megasphaera cerevisiae]SJZ39552.1 adenosylcobinamide-phosphate synthase [Megasphaera cerevisiae DSM 20462]
MITPLLAFLLDMLIGDPHVSFHPVALIGKLIARLEVFFYSPEASKGIQFTLGAILVMVVLVLTYDLICVALVGLGYLQNSYLSWFVQALILSLMICPRSLAQAGWEIYKCLRQHQVETARSKVGQIVGRDTEQLNEAEITRATVETIAENTVDGILSPLFFFAIGGLPLAVVYRAVNTLDSMIAYKNDRYIYFGRFAARVDDIFNYIPARMGALLFIAAAFLLQYDWRLAWHTMRRDAVKHPSPNGGYAEATAAGALGIRLGGYNSYFGRKTFRAYMGEAFFSLVPYHIMQCIYLMYTVTVLAVILTAFYRLGVVGLWN